MVGEVKKDYALLLNNLKNALYMTTGNPYTEAGSVFYFDSSSNDIKEDIYEYFISKRGLEEPPFLSFDRYEDILDRYRVSSEGVTNKDQLSQKMFWMTHLAGWKRRRKCPDDTAIWNLFGDTKYAIKKYRTEFKKDLEDIRYVVKEEKCAFYSPGTLASESVSEDIVVESRPASEYIVMCNYHIVSDYCGGRKELLKKILCDFVANIVDAERNRKENDERSLLPENEEAIKKLCEYVNRMMTAYDHFGSQTVKKDWLLARALSWLVIGAMLRDSLSKNLIDYCLKPYLPKNNQTYIAEDATTVDYRRPGAVVGSSVPELFWSAGKNWYEEARRPGARFHSVDIIDHILPSAKDTLPEAGSELGFPFRATDTDEHTIQCSRFSELLMDKDSIYHQGHFILIGEGGIGKTTTLMSAMVDAYDGKGSYSGESVIPLFIELSLAPDSQDSHAYDGTSSSVVHRLIYSMLQQRPRRNDRSDILRECMNDESSIAKNTVHELISSVNDEGIKFALLIDGLNEVSVEPFTGHRSSSAQGRILQEIIGLGDEYQNVTIILTSRNRVLVDRPSFHSFYLRGLVWEDIEVYLQGKGKTEKEISSVRNGDRGLLEVLSIPMFLTMYVRLQDTKGITTRGELMKVFFHERLERRKEGYGIYRQGDIAERIDRDGEQSVRGRMERGKVTLPLQWLFLDVLIPAIALEMESSHAFRISEDKVRSLLEFLFEEQESLYCGKYREFSNSCFKDQLGDVLQDVISDFTDAYRQEKPPYRQKPAKYTEAFLKYCESSLGILYREGEKTFGFIHQHFRDYFAAVCYINRMKIAHTAFINEDPDSAKAIMQLFDTPINPLLMVYIGEYLGEHHNVPMPVEGTGNSQHFHGFTKETFQEHHLLSELFNIYRGEDLKNKYSIYNLIEIIIRVRRDLSGSDLHDLDLRQCRFYNVHIDTRPGIDFSNALINAGSWFAEGHTSFVKYAGFSPDGKHIVTASNDHSARVWDTESGRLIHTFVGHTSKVTAASFSTNGSRIITASDDHTAKVWDTESGRLVHTLVGHSSSVKSVCFSSDDNCIVTASYDNSARIWDAESGELIHTLEGHGSFVNSACFSSDASHIVTASYDNSARIWDAKYGKLIHILEGHSSIVKSVQFSSDGNHIVTASDDHTAKVWDTESGRLIHTLAGHSYSVNFACFSLDGNCIVTASDDHTAKVWDTVSGGLIHTLAGHSSSVKSACFSPDGNRIVTASYDNSARIWDTESGEPIHILVGHNSFVNSSSFSPDGSRVVTASYDNSARIWDAESGELIHTLEGLTSCVHSAFFSADGSRIVTASSDQSARVWNVESGELLLTLLGHSSSVNSACFSPDDSRIVTASSDQSARIWDAESGELLLTLAGHSSVVNSACFSPDCRRVVTSSDDDSSKVWDVKSGRKLHTLWGHAFYVNSACFSPDCRRIVTASYDNSARIWDTELGELLLSLVGHSSSVNSACFSPDCRRIVTASNDGTVRVWDAYTGEVFHILEHSASVNSACFSPDCRRIVTASSDNTARVWDADTGGLLHTLEGHTDKVTTASFSPDSKLIVTASNDGTVRVWEVASGYLYRILYQVFGLHIKGVDFLDIDPRSKITETQKEIFREYGAII